MGGAVARVGDGDTAFAERSMPYVLNAVTGWHDPDAAEAHIDWARAVIEAASDASTGRAYVNFLGDADAARSSYGDETYDAPRRAEERVRPDERVPAEPEHRAAGRLLTNRKGDEMVDSLEGKSLDRAQEAAREAVRRGLGRRSGAAGSRVGRGVTGQGV